MHELALIEDLIETVEGSAVGSRVHVVRLVVGKESCASPEALKFCFDVCTQGTRLQSAALEIIETQGSELRLQNVEVTSCA